MSVQLCPMARSSRISSSTARWASTCCAASMRNLSQPSLCGRWDRGWAGGTTLSTIRDPDAGPRETGNSHGRARADPGPSCVTTPTAAGSCTAMAPSARASRRAALARLLRPMVALPCNGSRRGPMCQPTPRAEGSPCRNLPTRRRRLAICKPGARRSQRATGGSPRESRRSGRPRSSETPSRGDDQPPADFLTSTLHAGPAALGTSAPCSSGAQPRSTTRAGSHERGDEAGQYERYQGGCGKGARS
jgi:hypothetical protein